MDRIMGRAVPVGWSPRQIVERVGVSSRKVYYEIAAGTLKAHRIGGRVVVHEPDLLEWLHARPYAETPRIRGRGPKPRTVDRPGAPRGIVPQV